MASNLPVLSGESSLARYMQEISAFPMLDADEEYSLAKRWKEHGDVSAAHRLVTSHLRLVAKIAMGYRGYGLPVSDLISEGNIGMMQAVKRYDPDKGFRLSTYAMWWIKAAIQEYVLRSWSLVKIGTSAAQKKLFFNLKRIKQRLQSYSENALTQENVDKIAGDLNVSAKEVMDMESRMMQGGDQHLNAPIGEEGEREWIDNLASGDVDQETLLAEHEESTHRKQLFANAMTQLNDRERDILQRRRLQEPPVTLEDLSQEYGISRERVRQIEMRSMDKLQKLVLSADTASALPAPSNH